MKSDCWAIISVSINITKTTHVFVRLKFRWCTVRSNVHSDIDHLVCLHVSQEGSWGKSSHIYTNIKKCFLCKIHQTRIMPGKKKLYAQPGILFSLLCPSGCHTYHVNKHKCQCGCNYIQTAIISVRLWAAVVTLSANTVTQNTADFVKCFR